MEIKTQSFHIITNYEESKILLQKINDSLSLPEHEFEMADEIFHELKKQTGLETTLLSYIDAKEIKETNTEEIIFLSIAEENKAINNYLWIDLNELPVSFSQKELLEKWLKKIRLREFSVPWLNKNWFKQAKDYIPSVFKDNINQISQYYVSPISCILKIKTENGDIYCKRVLPGVFSDEPQITQSLYDFSPDDLPEIIYTDNENGYIFTKDFGKNVLGKSKDFNNYLLAVKKYAQLQLKMADKKEIFLQQGMYNRTLNSLPKQLKELLNDDKKIFLDEENCITTPERDLLLASFDKIEILLQELASYNIPETVEHGDLHPGNINIGENRIIFYDWSDCAISHPFFSMRVFFWKFFDQEGELKESLEQFPEIEKPYEKLVEAYLSEWKEYNNEANLRKAFDLSQEAAFIPFSIQYGLLTASMEEYTQPVYKYHIARGLRKVLKYISSL